VPAKNIIGNFKIEEEEGKNNDRRQEIWDYANNPKHFF
jgi:hypothetical protein